LEDRATQACDPSASPAAIRQNGLGLAKPVPLLPLEARKAVNAILNKDASAKPRKTIMPRPSPEIRATLTWIGKVL
jgi:hypothetical protein